MAVDTDANLAALAEHRHGRYAGVTDLVHLTGEVSVGAGVLAGGRLLRGSRGHAGELGHLCLDPAGPPCPCGRRGCLAALTALPAVVDRLLPDAGQDGPVTDYLPEIDRIVASARQDDPAVLAGLAEIGRHLGHGASILANLLNPEVIVLGGYFVTLAPWLLPRPRHGAGRPDPRPAGRRLPARRLHAGFGRRRAGRRRRRVGHHRGRSTPHRLIPVPVTP